MILAISALLFAQDDPLPPNALLRLGSTRFRHAGIVRSIAYSPDGRMLASTGDDHAVRLWEVPGGRQLLKLDTNGEESCAAFSPDGKTLAWGTRTSLHLWDLAGGKKTGELSGLYWGCRFAFSPDSRTLAVLSARSEVSLRDASTGEVRSTFPGDEPVHWISYGADGKTLAITGNQHIRLVDMPSGNEVQKLDPKCPSGFSPRADLSPDSKTLACAAGSVLRVWAVSTGKELLAIQGGAGYAISDLAFSPDGKTLASSKSLLAKKLNLTKSPTTLLQVWDLGRGDELAGLGGNHSVCGPIAFSPDGKTVGVGGGNGLITLWDLTTRQEVAGHKGHLSSSIADGAISPDGKLLASAGLDGTTRLWDAGSGKELLQLKIDPYFFASTLSFSSDGRAIAAGCVDSTVRLFSTDNGTELCSIKAAGGGVALSSDGKRVATGESVRDVATGRECVKLAPNNMQTVTFSPDDKLLASTNRGAVQLWDAATGREILRLQDITWPSVLFSPDGHGIAVGSEQGMHFHDVVTGSRRLAFGGGWMRPLVFSPDGMVLVCWQPGGIGLWEAATGKEFHRIDTLEGQVKAARFARDGRVSALGNVGGVLYLWDATPRPPERLGLRSFCSIWPDLVGEDARKGYEAILHLAAIRDKAVRLLKEKMAARPTEQVRRLAGELEHEDVDARDRATLELRKLVMPEDVHEVLEGDPSLEVRRRLEDVLRSVEFRETRLIRALEFMGNTGAKEMLEGLASRSRSGRTRRLAQAALRRIEP